MAAKELVLIPKQKLETLTDAKKDMIDVGTQTENYSVSQEPTKESKVEDTQEKVRDDSKFVVQRIADGVPGKFLRKDRQRRKTLKWKPY